MFWYYGLLKGLKDGVKMIYVYFRNIYYLYYI